MKNKFLYQWFSICSQHFEEDDACEACNTGRWIFLPTFWMGGIIHSMFPKLWEWWVNREGVADRFKNGFKDKRTGKKVDPFPNMK